MRPPNPTPSPGAPQCQAIDLHKKRCTDRAVGMIAGQSAACHAHWHAYFNQYRTKPLRFIRKASK